VPGCGSQVCGQHFMSNFIQYNDDSHKLMHSTLGTPNVQSHMDGLIIHLQHYGWWTVKPYPSDDCQSYGHTRQMVQCAALIAGTMCTLFAIQQSRTARW
jgi:hypothetical protein